MWPDLKEWISGTTEHPGVEWSESNLSHFNEVIDGYMAEWAQVVANGPIRVGAGMGRSTACYD